jgi:hypothetical protein
MRKEVLRMNLGQPDGVDVAKELARSRREHNGPIMRHAGT